MILLHQPWNIYQRQLDRERRHQVARRALVVTVYCLGALVLGILQGRVLCYLGW